MSQFPQIDPTRFHCVIVHGITDFKAVAAHIDMTDGTGTAQLFEDTLPLPVRSTPPASAQAFTEHLRPETKAAREAFMKKHYYRKTFAAQDAGDREGACRAFLVEHAARADAAGHFGPVDVDELMKARRAHLKRGHSEDWQFVLLGLWDGYFSHYATDAERADALNKILRLKNADRHTDEAIAKAVKRWKLPKGPGKFHFDLTKKD